MISLSMSNEGGPLLQAVEDFAKLRIVSSKSLRLLAYIAQCSLEQWAS